MHEVRHPGRISRFAKTPIGHQEMQTEDLTPLLRQYSNHDPVVESRRDTAKGSLFETSRDFSFGGSDRLGQ
jgi:hypothetical protein